MTRRTTRATRRRFGRGRAAGVLALALVLANCSGAAETPVFYRDLAAPGATLDAGAALTLINQYRAKEGVPALMLDPALVAIAKEQADRLAAEDSVRLSLTAGRTLAARLEAAGYPAGGAVRNVSAGYRTLAEAFSGWRELKTHNANMLSPRARRFGIATAYAPNSRYKVYWTAIFAEGG